MADEEDDSSEKMRANMGSRILTKSDFCFVFV